MQHTKHSPQLQASTCDVQVDSKSDLSSFEDNLSAYQHHFHQITPKQEIFINALITFDDTVTIYFSSNISKKFINFPTKTFHKIKSFQPNNPSRFF